MESYFPTKIVESRFGAKSRNNGKREISGWRSKTAERGRKRRREVEGAKVAEEGERNRGGGTIKKKRKKEDMPGSKEATCTKESWPI